MNKQWRVSNTFETLGDPVESIHDSYLDTMEAGFKLRDALVDMVRHWLTPEERPSYPGFAGEAVAWKRAEEIAGVKYDSDGNRTPESPTDYGSDAAYYIAKVAVKIEEVETE